MYKFKVYKIFSGKMPFFFVEYKYVCPGGSIKTILSYQKFSILLCLIEAIQKVFLL
jgi:hypothetical protein